MNEDEIGDDESFYDMTEFLPVISESSDINEFDNVISEPTTPTDENFYQINEDIPPEPIQPYIDEPITPSDELNPNFRYSILTQEQYIELMMKYVDEVKTILQLSSSIIKLLLHYFKWNKDRLLEKFYEINHDQFFQQAKVINPFSQNLSEISSSRTCLICCSDEEDDMFCLQCQHRFCQNCWKNYIINQIVNEGQAQTIVCPDYQCEILVNDELIQKILDQNQFVKHIYDKIILNSYVDHNPRARWCPGQNCGHIINATSLTSAYNYAQLITCHHCQTSFCFQCAQPWHDPIKCILLSQWTRKLLDDSQIVIWLKANTKSCPKCQVSIEKNGGCNHMTCRNCAHEFCWLCFGKLIKNRYIYMRSFFFVCFLQENGRDIPNVIVIMKITRFKHNMH
jgi:ariadne-1